LLPHNCGSWCHVKNSMTPPRINTKCDFVFV
jgi:hypothetical protein